MEHSAGILKTLRFHDIDLWTVTGAAPIKDMEVGIRSVLSHEQIEDGRIKTREGMKHTIRKGKAAGGLAYGYRVKLEYDSKGERIPGLREIEPFEAEIVRWIFEQYAKGQSPQAIAVNLNKQNTLGPRGLKWRDTAIRGHRSRGSGILNNEQYLGRLLWNRTSFRKNPVTEKRIARPNDPKDWEYGEAPHLRIINDALWTKVKQQQIKNEKLFDKTLTNRLNKSHRPQYLLSGILECAHCHGPYAIMAKDRYGCTNRKKKLPIDSLGGITCTNSKTISRHELEERVLAAFPEGLFSISNIEHVRDTLSKELSQSAKQSAKHRDQLVVNIKKLEQQQRSLMEQLAHRASEGRPAIPAFNDMIDDQEDKLIKLRAELKAVPATETEFKAPAISVSMYRVAIDALIASVKHKTDDDLDEWIQFTRQLIQKVVISPSPDGKSADLELHGRLATILASMAAWEDFAKAHREQATAEFARLLKEKHFKNTQEKIDFKTRFDAHLAEQYEVWKGLQVSVVAGAGSNLHLLPEQVKMVAGTGVDHNLQSTPVKMVAGARTHLCLLFRTAA